MRTQLLQIDLIDESVDMTAPGMRDYIGSVRIPLREVLEKGSIMGTFQVIDENSTNCGTLQVKIVLHDQANYDANHLDD